MLRPCLAKTFAMLFFVFAISSSGCIKNGGNGSIANYQDVCTARIEYTHDKFSIFGIEIPLPQGSSPVKIGSVTYEGVQIQQAYESVQIFEQHRLTLCSILANAPSDESRRVDLLSNIAKDLGRLAELREVIRGNNPEMLKNWLEAQEKIITEQIAKVITFRTSFTQKMVTPSFTHSCKSFVLAVP